MTKPQDPTPEELASPLFEAIWQAIKTWDVNAPWYSGYCGATGTHAAVILRAIAALSGSPQVEAGAVLKRDRPAKNPAPVAWLHTLHMEGGQTNEVVTRNRANGHGKPGKDYSEEYTVTSEPLYAHPPLPADGWKCAARAQGTAGGNDPADCNWPMCGCDPYADKVIAALEESGVIALPTPPASTEGGADA